MEPVLGIYRPNMAYTLEQFQTSLPGLLIFSVIFR